MRSGLRQLAVLVLVVAGLAAVAARVAAPGPERNANALAVCGVERWTVKTLQDKPKPWDLELSRNKHAVDWLKAAGRLLDRESGRRLRVITSDTPSRSSAPTRARCEILL
jgi:hypothetical protein